MGQSEVYGYLLKNRGQWLNSRQIAQGTGLKMGSVSRSLQRLRVSKQIEFVEKPLWRFKYRIHGEQP